MKVIFGTYSISRKVTGIYTLMQSLCKHYSLNNIVVVIAAQEDEYSANDIENFSNHDILLIKKKSKLFFPLIVFYKSLRFYFKSKADIAHIQSLWSISSLAIFMWARISKKPYIISPNGMLNSWALNQSKIKKKIFLTIIFKRIIRSASVIIVNSNSEKTFIENMGFNNKGSIVNCVI